MQLEIRKIREREFHDKIRTVVDDEGVADTRWSPRLEETIKKNPLWANMKYYAVERKNLAHREKWFRDHCRNKRILDYCCGNGDDGLYIAEQGAKEVIGIDISETSIKNCTKLAEKKGINEQTSYLLRDAEKTEFEDNAFDVITEYGALHHLDLDKAYPELARILSPNGKMLCTETLGHNPFIRLYRKLTPHLRTEWEVDHILKRSDIEKAQKHFGQVIILGFYHLSTLIAVPLRNTFLFKPILSILEIVDALLLRIPLLKWQAWQVIFELSQPRKSPTQN